ncbi:MAG: AI-2E family transporter [Sulfuricella sp.]|nr:AI-2E family transporter [Sulfuricella sp.]
MPHNPWQYSLVSLIFTSLILLAAFTVLQSFLLPIIWAAVIAITTWPLHRKILTRLGNRQDPAAMLSTLVVAVTLVGPMIALVIFVVEDVQTAIAFLLHANQDGVPPPGWLAGLPLAGEHLAPLWQEYLGQPNRLSQLLTDKLDAIQTFTQSVLLGVATRAAMLFFALWILYFFYRDGEKLLVKISYVGFKWLHKRWPSYAYHIPSAVRSAVNGLVIVGLGEGIIIGLMLNFAGVHSAVLLGMVIAALSLVPLLGPLLLGLIGLVLFAQGSPLTGVYVFAIGTTVLMLADYLVRPRLIQGSTELPFLAILFGIFGGIASMGILGLIIGPVILVLFLVLLREASTDEDTELEF